MAKKSRRVRRQEIQKQPKPVDAAQPEAAEVVAVPQAAAPVVREAQTGPVNNRKTINFAQEYFYVYFDMRNVVVISVFMFAVLVALSFAI